MTEAAAPDRIIGADRPKTFRVEGYDYTFNLQIVHPEDYAEVLRLGDEVRASKDSTLEEVFQQRDRQIEIALKPEDREEWAKLRAAKAIDLAGLDELIQWLTEVHTGRPTKQAEDSSPGPGSSAASSKAPGSSPAVTRVP